MNTWASW